VKLGMSADPYVQASPLGASIETSGSADFHWKENRMTKPLVILALSAIALLATVGNPASGDSKPVLTIDEVASTIGATPEQVRESIGCVLIEAERRLGTADYLKISSLIPGADAYRSQAAEACVFKGSISSGNELQEALGDLGLTPEQSGKLVSELAGYLSAAGDPSIGKLLIGAQK
jgi:hypothetical protein